MFPPGAGAHPPPRPRALAPFGVRSFRFQWPADLATSWAFEMETLILGWYVLVETGSVLLLTLFGSLQLVGTLTAPMVGVLGDRIGLRNLLCLARATYVLLAAILTLLAFTGTLAPHYVFAVVAVAGLVRPADLMLRNALIAETMPPAHLMAAMGIARTTADSARVAGALAGAGLVAALGIGPAYAIITSLYSGSLLLTLCIAAPGPGSRTETRASPWRDLGEAAAHVVATPHQLAGLCLAFLLNLTALPWTSGLLPYAAREVYGLGQTGLSWLVASFSLGALVGSIALSRMGGTIRPARMMILASVVWFALILLFARLDDAIAGALVLGAAGFVQSLTMVPLAVMLLRDTAGRLRGRIMGLRMLAVYGLPLGLLAASPLIERLGFAWTVTLYGALGMAALLAIAIGWRRHLWPLHVPANAG